MAGMHWSWEQLRAAPPYVRRYCKDFLRMRSLAQGRKA